MVVKLSACNYDECEFYIDEGELTPLLINYMLTLDYNPDIQLIITEYYSLDKYNTPIDLFKKNKQLLQKYNLDGIIYYCDIEEKYAFECNICKPILNTFSILSNYIIDSPSIKQNIDDNINIFAHAVNTKTNIIIV